MNIKLCLSSVITAILLLVDVSPAIEPADKDLIPEARAVLDYLQSIYGKNTLAGVSGVKNAEGIRQESGKDAAIVAIDLCGWNSPTWGKTYTPVVEAAVKNVQELWPKGVMLALAECEAIPNPDRMASGGPKWLYCPPWWGPGKAHPPEWIKQTYNHDFVITADELPKLRAAR